MCVVAGWALVVELAGRSRMRLSLVIGPASPLAPRVTFRGALALLNAVLACHLLPFVVDLALGPSAFARGTQWSLGADLLAHLVVVVALFAPPSRANIGGTDGATETLLSAERAEAHVKHSHPLALQTAHSRDSLVVTLWESFLAPFAPVTFWHVIVADYATSLAKALGDVHVTVCVASAHLSSSRAALGAAANHAVWWEEARGPCASSMLNASALALPFWVRLFQCLAVYRQTGEVKNLWNAAKYATAFPLVYAGYLERAAPSPFSRQLFVAAAVVQSSATFGWDVVMDWGLPAKRAGGELFGTWTLSAMREPRSHVVGAGAAYAAYGALVAFNLVLRYIWAVAVFGGASTRGAGMFAFELAEIARRTVWALFRIEWEYISKGHSLAPPRSGEGDGDAPRSAEEGVDDADQPLLGKDGGDLQ